MAPRIRYFSEDDLEEGVTPSQLGRMSAVRQWPYIHYWFHRMFEDPSNETPRMDSEFHYIWGGPYSARDEVHDQFGGLIADARLDAFVYELEGDGTLEWAPGPDHPDHERAAAEYAEEQQGNRDDQIDSSPSFDDVLEDLDRGAFINFGFEAERIARETARTAAAEMLAEFSSLQAEAASAGIGHNRPPPEAQSVVIHFHGDAILNTGEIVVRELVKPEPDVRKVAKAASGLKTWLSRLLLAPAGVLILESLKGGAGEVGKYLFDAHPGWISAIEATLTAVSSWLHMVVSFF